MFDVDRETFNPAAGELPAIMIALGSRWEQCGNGISPWKVYFPDKSHKEA